MNSPYIYTLVADGGTGTAVFLWPNGVKKYIRDTYTTDGELHLPPAGRLKLTRYKVNPKSGYPSQEAELDIAKFLAAP